jgi:hypothetical protein
VNQVERSLIRFVASCADRGSMTKMRSAVAWLALGAVFVGESYNAQEAPVADLSISASVPAHAPLRPGDVVRLTMTFSNNGPDPVAMASGVTHFPALRGSAFHIEYVPEGGCGYAVDLFQFPGNGSGAASVAFFAGPLDSGESHACTVDIVVHQEAFGSYELVIAVFGSTGFNLAYDSNLGNNLAIVPLSFAQTRAAIVVPSMGPIALVSLVLALVLAGWWRQPGAVRKRGQSHFF